MTARWSNRGTMVLMWGSVWGSQRGLRARVEMWLVVFMRRIFQPRTLLLLRMYWQLEKFLIVEPSTHWHRSRTKTLCSLVVQTIRMWQCCSSTLPEIMWNRLLNGSNWAYQEKYQLQDMTTELALSIWTDWSCMVASQATPQVWPQTSSICCDTLQRPKKPLGRSWGQLAANLQVTYMGIRWFSENHI